MISRLSKVFVALIPLLFFNLILAQQTQTDKDEELQQKMIELEKKSVEVLDLRSALTIQEAELEDLRSETDQLKNLRSSLVDSLKNKQDEIQNLKMILKALEEDKKLSQDMVKSISSSDTASTAHIDKTENENSESYSGTDTEFREIYNRALNFYFEGSYKNSIDNFNYLLSINTVHPLADNCQYWLGECYYSMELYADAIAEFNKVENLGDKNKADAALFKIGLSYLKMGNKEDAVFSFRNLERQYPESELVTKAKEYLTTQQKF